MTMQFAVLIDFDWSSGAADFSQAVDNVTNYCMGITINTGVQDASQNMAYVGACSLTLTNGDRRFSPAYTSGALYGKLRPGKPVKVTMTDGVTTWTLWRGFTTSISPTSGAYGTRQVTIECVDVMGRIQEELLAMPLLTNILSSTAITHVVNWALRAATAAALITLTAIPSAGNTVTIGNGAATYPLTWKSTLTGAADEVLIGADLAACTVNLAACINKASGAGTLYASNVTLPRFVSATPTTGTSYAETNVDTAVPLNASAMTGETQSVGAQPNAAGLGWDTGLYPGQGQTFQTTQAGQLTSIGFTFWTSGSAREPLTLVLREGGSTGTIVHSAAWTPSGIPIAPSTGDTWADYTFPSPFYLKASTTYAVQLLSSSNHAAANYWTLESSSSSVYASGTQIRSADQSAWSAVATADLSFRFTLEAVVYRAKLSQSFQVPNAMTIDSLTLYLSKWGAPADLTVRIESDSGGYPSGSLVDTNAETTVLASGVTSSYANVPVAFSPPLVAQPNTTCHIVTVPSGGASATDFYIWGADASSPGYTLGKMTSYTSGGGWIDESKDAAFNIGENSVALTAMLRGAIGNSYTIALTGAWGAKTDWAGGADTPTDPAASLETGRDTFPYCGDQWDANKTNAMSALQQIVGSEFGSWLWVSRSGALTFKNRSYEALRIIATPALTLDSQHNALDNAESSEDVFNKIQVSYTPASSLASGVVAAAKNTEIAPGLTGLTERWNPTQTVGTQAGTKLIKLPFADPTTGAAMGAASIVTPLVPDTDFVANEASDGTGYDYTHNTVISFSVAINGSNVEITAKNTAIGPLYLTKLQVRGVGIVRYNPSVALAEDADSQVAYGLRALQLDLPIPSNDSNFAPSLADYLLGKFKDPALRVRSITFQGQYLVSAVNLFSIEIGDTLALTDYQTGITSAKYLITGMSYEGIAPGTTGSITFYVRQLDNQTYWLLEDATYGVLGTTTRPGL